MEKQYYKYEYFSKSYTFLYPLLGFKSKELFSPLLTALYCDSIDESIVTYHLLVLYKFAEKKMFEKFENEKILSHKLLDKCYLTEDGILYVFNLSTFDETIDYFMNGEYSKFSDKVKKIICAYHITGCDLNKVNPKSFEDGTIAFTGKLYPMVALYPWIFKEKMAEEMFKTMKWYDTLAEALHDVRDLGDEICPVFDLFLETCHTKILSPRCV